MDRRRKTRWVWVWPHREEIEDGELSPASSDRTLNSSGLSNMSDEQIKRDRRITRLLDAYVRFYEKKAAHSTICRYLILIPCIAVICGCAIIMGRLCLTMLGAEESPDLEKLAAFITACVAFPVSIIGILHIITEYFFPKEDEKYITDIVKLVQSNDLENRRESARTRELPPDLPAPPPNEPSSPPDCEEEDSDLPGMEGSPPPYSDDEL